MYSKIIVASFLSIFMGSQVACTPIHNVVNSIVDCTKTDLPTLQNVLNNLRPLLNGDMPDWSQILSQAESAGTDIAGCAIAELVQGYLSTTKGVSIAASQAANQALAKIRAKNGGATFHFADHDL